MKKFFAKKQWMMVALVAALGVAVYLNYYFTTEPALSGDTGDAPTSDDTLGDTQFVGATVDGVPKEDAEDTAEDYFDKARTSRTAAREESLRIVQATLGRADASAEEKAKAEQMAAAVAERVLQESNIENMILAKGFADCVVFIDTDACSVVVQASQLQQQESLQILELVVSHAQIASDKVKIVASAT